MSRCKDIAVFGLSVLGRTLHLKIPLIVNRLLGKGAHFLGAAKFKVGVLDGLINGTAEGETLPKAIASIVELAGFDISLNLLDVTLGSPISRETDLPRHTRPATRPRDNAIGGVGCP